MTSGKPPSDRPADGAEVSGRAFLGLIRYVKDTHGDAAFRDVVESSGDATRAVFGTKIGLKDWYPYDSYARFLRALDRKLANGDRSYARTLGAVAGKRDLGTIFKVFVAIASPERLIRACDKIWPSYYRNAGSMEALDWRPERTVLRIARFPGMHPLHCKLMEGWMISTMATIGCIVADDARETECTSRGGLYHEFACTWKRA